MKKKTKHSVRTLNHSALTEKPAETGLPAEELPAAEDVPEEKPAFDLSPAIAGIGASAGGLDAFKKFFTAMTTESGIAFVLIPHLDPMHESLMAELLSQFTAMPVVEAVSDMPVVPNHVYIIPPNKSMTIDRGVLRLTGPAVDHLLRSSIDTFFRSLADDQQERAICIILSGTGSDGTQGLKAIKAAGGMTMVQDPATAEYSRMPQNAVSTGLADYILPVEQMPEVLLKYVQHAYIENRLSKDPDASVHLNQLLALLRTRTKFDFRCYRKKMLQRRIERRMGLSHFDSMRDYVAFLRDHPEELKNLVKDLFISVTNFFRDPEAIHHLATQVITPLVQSKTSDDVIRVWIPGCATGEEAYSIAIVIMEELAAAHLHCKIQIFATDIDDQALHTARQGIYPESIVTEVSAERLANFFTRVEDNGYQINKQVRETVVFAIQNLISDAPFTKLDLISCRNLFIYLEPAVQKKVVNLFHFALNEGGFLFLGTAETVGRQIDLFETESKKWRIYRKIGPTRPERVDFPITAANNLPPTGRRFAEGPENQPINFADVTQRLLLEQFAPAAVLINRQYEILYYFGPCTRYLDLPTGEPIHDLLLMARDGLRNKLRGAVHRAIRENELMILLNVPVQRNGSVHPVRVTVRPVPIPRMAEGLLLVTFEDQSATNVTSAAAPSGVHTELADGSTLRQLEFELNATREDLQSTIEELESSNEELKASNEEIMSMNEELQSANEELETSKEELQSLNEELSTVNNQLQEKVHELESTNNDMANLLICTDIATVFLDTTFHIKRFTPAATRLFHLITTDTGRNIADISRRFHDPALLGDAQQVLRQLVPREHEVSTGEGSWWIRRIIPYRTRDNRIEGVIISFTDVTVLKQTNEMLALQVAERTKSLQELKLVEESLRESEERFTRFMQYLPGLAWIKDSSGRYVYVNAAAEKAFQTPKDELYGKIDEDVFPPEVATQFKENDRRAIVSGRGIEVIETLKHPDGATHYSIVSKFPIPVPEGGSTLIGGMAIDITDRRRAEQALRRSERELADFFENATVGLHWVGEDGIVQRANRAELGLLGYTSDEYVGRHIADFHVDKRLIEDILNRLRSGEEIRDCEAQLRCKDGSIKHVLINSNALWEDGRFVHSRCFTRDITARKQAEEALRATEQRFRLMADSAPVLIWISGVDKLRTWFNSSWLEFTGRPMLREIGNGWTENVHADDFDRCMQTYTSAFDERQSYSMEYRLRRHDGEYRWILDRGTPLYGNSREFTGFIGSSVDINERKQAEAALKAKDAELELVTKITPVMFTRCSRDLRYLFVNPAAAAMFRRHPAELIGQPIANVMGEKAFETLKPFIEQVLQGEPVEFEAEMPYAIGTRWVRVYYLPDYDDQNEVAGWIASIVDITEQKQVTAAIIRRMAAIVENSADGILSKDLDGTIQTWNRGAERLYGYSREEVLHKSITMFIPEDLRAEWVQIMDGIRRGEVTAQFETERLRKDGKRIPVVLTISPLRDKDGRVVGASEIVRDISELKQMVQALRDREGRLQTILTTAVDAIFTVDYRGLIRSANPAAERMFGYSADEMVGQNVQLLMPDSYRENRIGYLTRFLHTGERRIVGIWREFEGRRKDGTVFPVELAVSEVEPRRLFTGMIRDITVRKQLEHDVVESAAVEQQRIGRDLHDSVGQELTALNILAKDLDETVRSQPAQASQMVERLTLGLQRTQKELRSVLRGLLPVSVANEALMVSLAELADRTLQERHVNCVFECPQEIDVADNLTATHFYYIAQEAVHNAVLHGNPGTITISLSRLGDELHLSVQDDGIGISLHPPGTESRGLGLRIMKSRAAIIGAKLTIQTVQPTGTLVNCVLARRNHDFDKA